MNKFLMAGCLGMLAVSMTFTSCKSDDDNNDNGGGQGNETGYVWTTDGGFKACDHILFSADGKDDPNGTQIGNGDQNFVFNGKQTLKKGKYTLKGWVYIAKGAELIIEPGTVIMGDKQTKAALIAERGGKLIAQGSADAPIVFTSEEAAGSRKPGDWGGVILCGNAVMNKGEQKIEGGPRSVYGGNDDADNSGVLSYVRIEFAGYPFDKDKEINGLSLGAVGSGTKIDHVQVSYSCDDSFEWWGGKVNCDHLIAYKGWDDDFDTDNGFSGHVQFGLVIRDPRIADGSQSNGFESDNDADGSTNSPFTSAVFSNITFVGPKVVDGFQNTTDYINGGGLYPEVTPAPALGKFQSAMQIRRNSHLNCFNSVAVGYPIGLLLDNQKGDTQKAATDGVLKLQNLVFADMDVLGSDANKVYEDKRNSGYDAEGNATVDASSTSSFSSEFFKLASNNNQYFPDKAAIGIDFTTGIPTSGSILLKGASFTDALLSGFSKVDYIGAFAAGDTWATGWTEFDPQHKEY